MKRKIISTVIYAVTALAVAGFVDGLYGAGPIIYHSGLVHIAIAGVILFVTACILSLFSTRFATVCGLLAGILSWPLVAIPLSKIPWGNLIWFARYRPDTLAAIVALIVSSAYTLYLLGALRRESS